MKNNNYVYVVFSKTSTKIGKMIRTVTKNEYNHVSLSFDKNLGVMYSFARYKYHSPLAGGFVVEYPSRYVCFVNDAKIKICRIRLSNEKYDRLKKRIERLISKRENFCYNTFNAILYPLHLRIDLPESYTCIDFVSKILGIRAIRSIKDLENRLQKRVIYEGSMKKIVKDNCTSDDNYFEPQSFCTVCSQSFAQFKKLFKKLKAAR